MEWFEDDDFWRDLFPAMFPPERFAAAEEQVDRILALTKFSGRTVLDLCCGPGRHAVALAQRGLKVTGVDRTAFLLERARERALEANVDVEWVEQDMRLFERSGAFDLACSLFTSFGYFEDESDNLRVLRNVHSSLCAGGAFIIDVMSKEKVARSWQNVLYSKLDNGSILFQRPEVLADWTKIRSEWTLVEEGRARLFAFEHTVYSGRELKELLIDAGFASVTVYGDLEGRPYGIDATRLIAVARKS